MSIDPVLVVTLVIILVFAIIGAVKGFVKMVVSFASIIITLVLVWFLQPYVSDFLKNFTPVYSGVKSQCVSYVQNEIGRKVNADPNQDIGNVSLDGQMEKILSDSRFSLLANYLDDASKSVENATANTIASISDGLGTVIADVFLQIITWLGTFILITIILKIAIFALDLLTKLPVLHSLNKTAGFILGAIIGLMVIWVSMLIVIVFFNTSIGAYVLNSVNNEPILKIIHENNPLFLLIFR